MLLFPNIKKNTHNVFRLHFRAVGALRPRVGRVTSSQKNHVRGSRDLHGSLRPDSKMGGHRTFFKHFLKLCHMFVLSIPRLGMSVTDLFRGDR